MTVDYGWDITFRHGKIIRVSFFTDEEKARQGDVDVGMR